jgi:hypothetical protein
MWMVDSRIDCSGLVRRNFASASWGFADARRDGMGARFGVDARRQIQTILQMNLARGARVFSNRSTDSCHQCQKGYGDHYRLAAFRNLEDYEGYWWSNRCDIRCRSGNRLFTGHRFAGECCRDVRRSDQQLYQAAIGAGGGQPIIRFGPCARSAVSGADPCAIFKSRH